MKYLLLLAVVACALARTLDDDVALYSDFKDTFGRKYSPSEEAHHFKCFRQNMDIIEKFNALGQEVHGVNKFTDLCAEDFKTYHNLQMSNRTKNYAPLFSAAEVQRAEASSIDWRTRGAVTGVKNQGMCGSCWSFSATGNMEGQWKISGKALVGLSEEELVQCSHNGNMGCNGGLMDYAFEWVTQNGGIDSEASYPYTSGSGQTGTCQNSKLTNHVAKFASHVDIAQSEAQMATWIEANGPLAVAVDASSGWQTYSGGIMTTCSGRQLDHGVLAVGFGTSGATNYWIVKNSWGVGWGESGYIRLQKGTNQCGIDSAVSSARV
jgi:cathepsin F/cysteine peptidase B